MIGAAAADAFQFNAECRDVSSLFSSHDLQAALSQIDPEIQVLALRTRDAAAAKTFLENRFHLVGSAGMPNDNLVTQLWLSFGLADNLVKRTGSRKWQEPAISDSGFGGAGTHAIVRVNGRTILLAALSLAPTGASQAVMNRLRPSIPGDGGMRSKWGEAASRGGFVTREDLRTLQSSAFCYATERVAKQVESQVAGIGKPRGWYLPVVLLLSGLQSGERWQYELGCGPPWRGNYPPGNSCALLVRSADYFRRIMPDLYEHRRQTAEATHEAIDALGVASCVDCVALGGGEVGVAALVVIEQQGPSNTGASPFGGGAAGAGWCFMVNEEDAGGLVAALLASVGGRGSALFTSAG